jgi:hypothetical protein
MPLAARSMAQVCDRSLAEIVGSSPAEGMGVFWECCVFSGTGLCDGLITRPEQSYLVLCVIAKPRQWGNLGPQGAVEPREGKKSI